jgi:hypothetical protein
VKNSIDITKKSNENRSNIEESENHVIFEKRNSDPEG